MQIEGLVGAGEAARRLSVQVSELADDVRALAASALAGTAVDWSSAAADAFRRSLEQDCTAVRQAAVLLEAAAAAVARHGQAADGVLHDAVRAAKAFL